MKKLSNMSLLILGAVGFFGCKKDPVLGKDDLKTEIDGQGGKLLQGYIQLGTSPH